VKLIKIEHILWEKVKLGKFSTDSQKISEIGWKSKTEVNASLPQGMDGDWTPLFSSVGLQFV